MNNENSKGSKFITAYGSPTGLFWGSLCALVVLIITAIIFVTSCYAIVKPSYEGLVIKGGQLQNEVKSNGFYLKLPFWTDFETVYTGAISTDEDNKGNFKEENPFRNIQPLSKDGQVMVMDAQISYAISDAKKFREVTGSTNLRKIESLFLVPTLRKIVYDYTSEYTWKGLINEGDRQEFGNRIFRTMVSGEATKRTCKNEETITDEVTGTKTIKEASCEISNAGKLAKADDYGIIITAINFKKIEPNEKIIQAVEEAQAKEQQVKIAIEERKIATENANTRIETKRGETESRKLEADANAYKIRVEKEEEAKGVMALAEAEKARASALRESSALVEYKKLDIEMIKAEAELAWAKTPRPVPTHVTIIGTDEANDMKMFMGAPGVTVSE